MNNKTIFKIVGSALSCAGIVYVVFRLSQYASDIKIDHVGSSGLFWLFVCVLAYAAINIFLALAWGELLRHFGQNISKKWIIKAFGISQISKYVPGNVFHLAGRHIIGVSKGVPNADLFKSLLWELFLLAFSGGMFIILVLPLVINSMLFSFGWIFFFFSILCGAFLLKSFFSIYVLKAYFLYLVFLSIAGCLFAMQFLIVSVDGHNLHMIYFVAPSFIVAWLIGFITPGAPAGIGVRELVMLFLLENTFDQSDLLLSVVISRAITAGGDLVYFLTSLRMKHDLASS